MKRIYEFIDTERFYDLLLNGRVVKTYAKRKYSRQQAEDHASKEVQRAVRIFGNKNIEYNGSFINA